MGGKKEAVSCDETLFLPVLLVFLSVSGAVCLSSSEGRRLALDTHAVPLPQVLHPLGVRARALLASLCQRGQLKLDTIPVSPKHTQTKLRLKTDNTRGEIKGKKSAISHFSGDVLPYNVAAVRDVSFLPGVAIATSDNKRWDCRGNIHDKSITCDRMLQHWGLMHLK